MARIVYKCLFWADKSTKGNNFGITLPIAIKLKKFMVYKHYNSWEWETFINLISSIKWIQTQYRLYGIDMRNYSRLCDYKAVRLNFKKYNILAQLKGEDIENPSTISFPIFF